MKPGGEKYGRVPSEVQELVFYDVSASFSVLTCKWKEDANVKGQNEEQVKK